MRPSSTTKTTEGNSKSRGFTRPLLLTFHVCDNKCLVGHLGSLKLLWTHGHLLWIQQMYKNKDRIKFNHLQVVLRGRNNLISQIWSSPYMLSTVSSYFPYKGKIMHWWGGGGYHQGKMSSSFTDDWLTWFQWIGNCTSRLTHDFTPLRQCFNNDRRKAFSKYRSH